MKGEEIVVFSAAIAILIADGLTPDEISLLGSIFTTVGDSLSTIASARALEQAHKEECEKKQGKQEKSN